MIFLLKIFQFNELINKIDENFQLQYKVATFFNLFKLLFTIIIVAHFCGCGFHFITYYNVNNTSWSDSLEGMPCIFRYIDALYFAFTTMITVGFGDIVPKNINEKIYVMNVQLLGCGVFAYVVSAIGNIFQDIAKKTDFFKQQKYEIMDYMLNRNISSNTQIKIIKYLGMFLQFSITFYMLFNRIYIEFLRLRTLKRIYYTKLSLQKIKRLCLLVVLWSNTIRI